MAAVRSRQHAHARAFAAHAAKCVTKVAPGAELEARGEAHRFEVLCHHAVTPVQTRLRELQRLLAEVDQQKWLRGTHKQHMRGGVSVKWSWRKKGVCERGVCFDGSPSHSDDREKVLSKFIYLSCGCECMRFSSECLRGAR